MRVVLYARVSSEAQDVSLSISAQLKSLREFAERNGHIIVREFIEPRPGAVLLNDRRFAR